MESHCKATRANQRHTGLSPIPSRRTYRGQQLLFFQQSRLILWILTNLTLNIRKKDNQISTSDELVVSHPLFLANTAPVDTEVDGDIPSLALELTNSAHDTVLSPKQHTPTIQDNNPTPFLRFSQDTYVVSENDGIAIVSVTLDHPSSRAVYVDVATSPGTALPNSDYATSLTTLVWAPGETNEQSIVVVLIDDGSVEERESLFLQLTNVVAAAIGTPNRVPVSIADDDFWLTVSTPHGVASPSGMSAHTSNEIVTATLAGSPVVSVPLWPHKWLPADGPEPVAYPIQAPATSTTFTITNQSSLTWNWGLEYWLEVATVCSGTVNVISGWQANGINSLTDCDPSQWLSLRSLDWHH